MAQNTECILPAVYGFKLDDRARFLLETLSTSPKHLYLTNDNKQRVYVHEPRLNMCLFATHKVVLTQLRRSFNY